jgi:hypothetical protein
METRGLRPLLAPAVQGQMKLGRRDSASSYLSDRKESSSGKSTVFQFLLEGMRPGPARHAKRGRNFVEMMSILPRTLPGAQRSMGKQPKEYQVILTGGAYHLPVCRGKGRS